MDRIYTVQPQQMSVNRPSLTPDLDYHTAPSHDLLSETIVLHMNIRIRIAEMSRAIVDALPLGSGDVDTLPYSKIASLDQKYEGILADLPALPTTDFASLDRSKRKIALERSIGIISVNARRAKFLRPLLPIKDMPQRFEAFRKQCLQSTQTVIEIASTVLSDAVDTPKSTSGSNRGSSYHSGLVTMHVRVTALPLERVLPFHIEKKTQKNQPLPLYVLLYAPTDHNKTIALYGLRRARDGSLAPRRRRKVCAWHGPGDGTKTVAAGKRVSSPRKGWREEPHGTGNGHAAGKCAEEAPRSRSRAAAADDSDDGGATRPELTVRSDSDSDSDSVGL